ncbi:MAG: hypothetical protein AAGK97_05970, partial [Bacteroidota bacterium]
NVAIIRIIKWYRFLELENLNNSSALTEKIDLKLVVHETTGNTNEYLESKIELLATGANSMNGKLGFMPKAILKHVKQDLFLYLFYLRENYAIECPDDEIKFSIKENTEELPEIFLWKEIRGFGPESEQLSVTSHFKLLITTEQLDFFQFLQNGLGVTRSELSTWNPGKISNDWAVRNIKVSIKKEA